MYINQFETSTKARLSQILHTLKQVHGTSLNIDTSSPTAEGMLMECKEAWEQTKNKIIAESSFNSYQQNPSYIKSMLILEAVAILLTEIAPKRRKKSMAESINVTTEADMAVKPTISIQLSDIAAKVPQTSDGATAFSNILASMADKFAHKEPLDSDEKMVWDWIRSLPRPVNAIKMVQDGIAQFGTDLLNKRNAAISSMPKVDMDETAPEIHPDDEADYAEEPEKPVTALSKFKRKNIPGLYTFDHWEDPDGNWIQISSRGDLVVYFDKNTGKRTEFDDLTNVKAFLDGKPYKTATPIMENVDIAAPAVLPMPEIDTTNTIGQAHHYEYQASMARSELYRNSKYAMSMLKQVDATTEIQPWIAASLTKAADYLDKVYHYLDYAKKFEPEKLPEDIDAPLELTGTSGAAARQSLVMIMEYSIKLFNIIKPNDKLEGWVAMKLTTASENVSSCKHYMDYVQFENHAMDDHFSEGKRANRKKVAENRNSLGTNNNMKNKLAETAFDRDLDETKPVFAEYIEGVKSTEKKKKFKNFAAYTKWHDENHDNVEVRHVYNESWQINEQEDLAKASTVLAAKDMSNKIQDIAEDVAKMSVEDLMPLVDIMRGQFGPEAATGFNTTVKAALDALLDLTTQTKGIMDQAVDTLNGGGIPTETSDLEAAGAEMPDIGVTPTGDSNNDIDKDLAALDSTAGAPVDPLGRSKKSDIAEAKNHMGDKEYRTYSSWKAAIKNAANGKPIKWIGDKDIGEAHVDGKGIGEWDGEKGSVYSATSIKESTTIAIRDFISANSDQFKSQYGNSWEKVLYATAWKRHSNKSPAYESKMIELSEANFALIGLETEFAKHKASFKKSLSEGKVSDPLNMGYGLEGDRILNQMSIVNKTIAAIKASLGSILQEGVMGMLKNIQALNKANSLEDMKNVTPYGVVYTTDTGKKSKKMFENADQRNYWLDFKGNNINNVKLIDPSTFDLAINKAKKG